MVPLVREARGTSTRESVLWEAEQLASEMVARGRPVINLCQGRGNFIRVFSAAAMARCHTVLPPSPLPVVLDGLEAEIGGAFRVDDAWVEDRLPMLQDGSDPKMELPETDFDAVTLYTSGSTGASRAHSRRWNQLRSGARLLADALGLSGEAPRNLLATVVPQHMFGFEATVLLPLLQGQAVAAGQPLFPADVKGGLEALPEPRGLVTTPLHLRACLDEEQGDWPAVDFVLSATAPLEPELAKRAEERMGAVVHEIYGSTETGALATRRPARETLWQPLPGVKLSSTDAGWSARGEHFPACRLADRLEWGGDGGFRLLGRDDDLVKVAGKRHSLAALSHLLQQAPEVRDGVMLAPGDGLSERRLTALFVADDTDADAVRAWLRERMDPAFMPRPLVSVAGLPRDRNGKLPRRALDELLDELREST
jgi:acyl-coenzyme A synthetase/AMP-(fatty) acid ligase